MSSQDAIAATPPRKSSRHFDYSVPQQPSRPFSSSAAKRSSVMALGSISHLQHYFVKEAKKAAKTSTNTSSPHPQARQLPGLGSFAEQDELDDEDEDLPPTPTPPAQSHTLPWTESDERPVTLKDLRIQCCEHVERVCQAWRIVEFVKSRPTSSLGSSPEMAPRVETMSPEPLKLPVQSTHQDTLVLDLLHVTTLAIRAIQQFVVSLPPDTLSSSFSNMALGRLSDSPLSSRHHSHLGISTTSRPRTSLGLPAAHSRPMSSPNAGSKSKESDHASDQLPDPRHIVRKASLELLGMLRQMDASFRLTPDEAGSIEMTRRLSGASSSSNASQDSEGHLYKQIKLDQLGREQDQVRTWIEIVDSVLFVSLKTISAEDAIVTSGGLTDLRSDHHGELIRVPSPLGMHDQQAKQLPDWALPHAFAEEPLRQAHAVLVAHLPIELLFNLLPPHSISGDPQEGSRQLFLESLSDGQLLCIAFNAALRKSARPWGFIQPDEIHNLISVGESRREPSEATAARIGLTFRRLENLRVWAAALRLRYGIMLGPSKDRGSTKPTPDDIVSRFDTKSIARKDKDWQDMLEVAITQWSAAICQEKREEFDQE